MSGNDIIPLSSLRWLSNRKLRAASFAQRGALIDLMCHLQNSDECGILRWDLEKIADAMGGGAALSLLRSLASERIIQGAPAGQMSEPFMHLNRKREPIELIPSQPGPIWFSPRMVLDQHIRSRMSRGGKKSATNRSMQGQQRSQSDQMPNDRLRTFEGAPTFEPTFEGDNGKPPPDGFPPHPPSLTSPSAQRNCAREEKSAEAVNLAEARTYATNWITANIPTHLKRSRIDSFIALIISYGKERATEEVLLSIRTSNPSDPFSYTLAAIRGREKDRERSGVRGSKNGTPSNGVSQPIRCSRTMPVTFGKV